MRTNTADFNLLCSCLLGDAKDRPGKVWDFQANTFDLKNIRAIYPSYPETDLRMAAYVTENAASHMVHTRAQANSVN